MIDKNKIEYALLISIAKIISLFSFDSLPRIAKFLTPLFFNIIRIRREVILKNLRIAFPNQKDKFYLELTRQNYFHFLLTLLELIKIPKLPKVKIDSLLNIINPELFLKKKNFGKGLILLTAHFGNWELGAISVGSQTGTSMTVLAKPQRNDLVFKWLNIMRESFGNKAVRLGPSVREIYKALKEKEAVGIVGDQRGPKEGMRVKFFDRETAVFSGTAAISLRTGSPILIGMVVRKEDYTYEILFEEIETENIEGTLEEEIKFINQSYMEVLERYVRKYPGQWFWMHNIWKY